MKRRCGRFNCGFGVSNFGFSALPSRIPHSAFRNSFGFTYLALLAAIIILGISLGAATKYWQNVILREKEEELLFRGDQYREAIRKYTYAVPGVVRTPASIDDLLMDSRLMGRRFLRQKYKDPITGEDFAEIFGITQNQGKRFIGVHSSSDKEPLKQSNFPDQYKDFEGKKKYSEWIFTNDQSGVTAVVSGQKSSSSSSGAAPK